MQNALSSCEPSRLTSHFQFLASGLHSRRVRNDALRDRAQPHHLRVILRRRAPSGSTPAAASAGIAGSPPARPAAADTSLVKLAALALRNRLRERGAGQRRAGQHGAGDSGAGRGARSGSAGVAPGGPAIGVVNAEVAVHVELSLADRRWRRHSRCRWSHCGNPRAGAAASGPTSSARTGARIHHNITSAGTASTVETMKKSGQPIASASTPASGPTQTRPTEAKALSSANCVAVKRWLHRPSGSATKAAVPMPPEMFSTAITISRPPSTGVACASSTKPESNGRDRRAPAAAPCPPTASHQKPTLLAICSTPNSISARHKPELEHQRAAEQRAADGQPQADDLVDHADLGRAEGHAPAAGTASSTSRRRRRPACTAR